MDNKLANKQDNKQDNKLYVWLYLPQQSRPVLCGMLTLLQGRRCVFAYDAAWLAHPQAFALSPDMPLHAGQIEPPAGLELHPVFDDAGPDRWGKNIINKVFNPARSSHLEYLELAGEDRIGALAFSRSGSAYQVAEQQQFYVENLSDLLQAAHALQSRMPVDERMSHWLKPGSSAGGAHPKALLAYEGQAWLAKFPSLEDDCDVCALEYASLRLAALCGVLVPPSQLLQIGNQRVLLLKRFDREQGARCHYASARTLLLAEGIAEADMAYADLADLIRRISPHPQQDCEQLFRRMVFNVMLENTDDHAKNHAFLWQANRWCLSPAFDMLPQRQGLGYHSLRIGKLGYEPSIENVRSDLARFMLKPEAAERIIGQMRAQCSQWRTVFAEAGVGQQDIELCARYVMRDSG